MVSYSKHGYRILCRVENGEARFLTREAQEWTHRFSGLVKAAEELSAHQLFLDGEIVALDANEVNDFQLLQNSLKQNSSANLVYYILVCCTLDRPRSYVQGTPGQERRTKKHSAAARPLDDGSGALLQ